jgi:hypothetical protein
MIAEDHIYAKNIQSIIRSAIDEYNSEGLSESGFPIEAHIYVRLKQKMIFDEPSTLKRYTELLQQYFPEEVKE